MTRYIGYPCIQGFAGSSPEFFNSIEEATDWLRRHGDSYFLGYDESRDLIDLYRVDDDPEAIESAKEFDGVGCPFDYPTFRLEFGPRGGVRKLNC